MVKHIFAPVLLLGTLVLGTLVLTPSQAQAQAQPYNPWLADDDSECGKRALQILLDDPYEGQHTLTGQIQAPHPEYSYDLYMASDVDENGIYKGKLILHSHNKGKHQGQLSFVFIDEVIVIPPNAKTIWIKVDKDYPWGVNNFKGDIDMEDPEAEYFCLSSFRSEDDAKR